MHPRNHQKTIGLGFGKRHLHTLHLEAAAMQWQNFIGPADQFHHGFRLKRMEMDIDFRARRNGAFIGIQEIQALLGHSVTWRSG